eukprot:558502-Amorphochlora_amoeboformis.AAC.1
MAKIVHSPAEAAIATKATIVRRRGSFPGRRKGTDCILSLKHRAEGLRCDRVTQAALIEKLLKRIQSLSDERKIHVGELARISDTVKRLRIQTEQAEKARVLADDQARMIKGQDERLSDLKKELEIQTERADARARELVVQAKLIEKLEKGTEEQLAIESSKDDKAARTE